MDLPAISLELNVPGRETQGEREVISATIAGSMVSAIGVCRRFGVVIIRKAFPLCVGRWS